MNMTSPFRRGLLGCLVCATLASSAAMAQDTPVPGHPRVNEVNERLSNQQTRIQNGVADGQVGAKQAAHDEQHDANIAQRESADEARHNGHLTKPEQRRLNRAQNRNSSHIYRQRH